MCVKNLTHLDARRSPKDTPWRRCSTGSCTLAQVLLRARRDDGERKLPDHDPDVCENELWPAHQLQIVRRSRPMSEHCLLRVDLTPAPLRSLDPTPSRLRPLSLRACAPRANPVAVWRWCTTPNSDLRADEDEARPLTPLQWLRIGGAPEIVAGLAGDL